jgi:glutathione S-transferase
VICEYLDRLHDATPMIPADGDARWQVLREQALADGILDCAVLIFVELRRRPEELRWDWWLELKRRAITRSLDWLERELAAFEGRVDLGVVSIGVALGYLDLRGAVGEWRAGRPGLAAWYADFAQRPSMIATAVSP